MIETGGSQSAFSRLKDSDNHVGELGKEKVRPFDASMNRYATHISSLSGYTKLVNISANEQGSAWVPRWVLFIRAQDSYPFVLFIKLNLRAYVRASFAFGWKANSDPGVANCRHTMFRARASGFLVGFGTAGVLAAYQLRQDIVKSHEATLKQVGTCPVYTVPQHAGVYATSATDSAKKSYQDCTPGFSHVCSRLPFTG